MPYGCNYKRLLLNLPVSQQAQEKHLDSFTAFRLTGTWCWYLFTVGSTYEPSKNRFAFPRLVREERHCVTVYVCIPLHFPRNTSTESEGDF